MAGSGSLRNSEEKRRCRTPEKCEILALARLGRDAKPARSAYKNLRKRKPVDQLLSM
jgi:hypothetical protein